MQMYMFVIEVFQKQTHYPAPPSLPGTPPDDPRAHTFASSCFEVYNCPVVGQGNCDIDKGGGYGQSQSKITAVSGNADQSDLDIHFDSQIHPYISFDRIYSQQKST